MLGSERTFKIKVRLRWIVRRFAHVSNHLHFLHKNEIVQYLQNHKRHEFDQGHSSFYRVLQVTFK